MSKKFIGKALGQPGDKGRLHRALHIPEGSKIPADVLARAAKAHGRIGQEARFALRLKSFHH